MGDNLLWVKSSKLWWEHSVECGEIHSAAQIWLFAHAVIAVSFIWKDGAQQLVDNEKLALCYKNIMFEKKEKEGRNNSNV